MGRLVQGQEATDGVQGQNTGTGFQAQAPGTTDVLGGPEGQIADNDVEGQESDRRPYRSVRPAVNTQAPLPPGHNASKQSPLPPATRRSGGSQKRSSTVSAFGDGTVSPGARGAYNR